MRRKTEMVESRRWGNLWLSIRFALTCQEHLWPLFFLYALNRKRRKGFQVHWEETHVSRNLDLVVDGFPGSGNSYFVKFLKKTQEPSLKMAHHLHAANQLVRAVKYGIPAALVLRQPVDAVCSMHRRFGYPLAAAMRVYVDYHEVLEPYLDGLLLCRFEEVTQNPGRVVQALNERFGLEFRTEYDPEETEGLWAIGKGLQSLSEEEKKKREEKKKALQAQAIEESAAEHVERAHELYERFTCWFETIPVEKTLAATDCTGAKEA